MIRTTIHISEETLATLIDASFKLNMPETDIIKLLMMNAHLDNKKDDKYLKIFSIIKYQERDPEIKWLCFHISLTPEEYEHFIDMRKMFKMSVSHIIAFSLKKYIKTLLEKHPKNKKADNNPPIYFPIYIFYVDLIHGVKSYVISNEIPKNLPVKTNIYKYIYRESEG